MIKLVEDTVKFSGPDQSAEYTVDRKARFNEKGSMEFKDDEHLAGAVGQPNWLAFWPKSTLEDLVAQDQVADQEKCTAKCEPG